MPPIGQWKRPQYVLSILIVLVMSIGTYTVFHPNNHRPDSLVDQNTLLHSPVGQYRPGFVLPDIAGKLHNIDEWDTQVLIVNFWATWCKPCRREIPMFTQLQATKGQSGLQFIGIAIDEISAVNNFISDLGVPTNYPMLVGEDDAITIAKRYGNEFGILPYTVIIDRAGKIAYIQYGEFSRSEVEHQIIPLL